MSIPQKILKLNSQYLSQESFNIHQTLAKKLLKFKQKKNLPSSLNHKKCPNKNYNKSEIFRWFFSLSLSERIKKCSIQNKWLTKILFEMYSLLFYENNVIFQPTNVYEEFYNKQENFYTLNNYFKNDYSSDDFSLNSGTHLDFYTTFFKAYDPTRESQIETDNYENKKAESAKEKNFIKEIRFLSINDMNDTLSLSIDLLNDNKKLENFFNYFSDNQSFLEPIDSIQIENSKLFNFLLPNWAKSLNEFTFCKILIIFFEQIISIHYQFYINNINLPIFNSDSKIEEILEMNSKIENFICEEVNCENGKENFLQKINFNEISEYLIQNSEKQKLLKEFKDIYKIVYSRFFGEGYFKDDDNLNQKNIEDCEKYLKKIFNTSIPSFVDQLSFINFEIVFKEKNFVYNFVFEKIKILYSNKNADELLNENDLGEIKKNKKNKKKKKKNNNENNHNEINNKNNNLNQFNKEINNNNNINNKIKNENNNKVIINNNDNIKSVNEKKIKIKKDDFYLFPTNNKSHHKKKNKKDKKNNEEKTEININNNSIKIEDNNNISNNNLTNDNLSNNNLTNNNENKNNINEPIIENKNKISPLENITIINDNNLNINQNFQTKNYNENLQIENLNNVPNTINSINIEENEKKKKEKKYKIKKSHKKRNQKLQEDNRFSMNFNVNSTPLLEVELTNNFSQTNDSTLSTQDNLSQNVIISKNFNYVNNLPYNNNNNNNNFIDQNNIPFNNNNNNNNLSQFLNSINVNNPIINNYYLIENKHNSNSTSFQNNNNFFPSKVISQNKILPIQFNYPYSYYNNYNLVFNILSNQIKENCKNVTNNLNLIRPIKEEYIYNIKKIINQSLENLCDIELYLYGSFVTDLSIESSDVDILVIFHIKSNITNNNNSDNNIEKIINILSNNFKKESENNDIEFINPIYTASVPVLKIQCDISKKITNNIKEKMINLNLIYDEIIKIKFDITFREKTNINQILNVPSINVIEFIKNSLICFNEIKPVLLILKRYMQIQKLNSSFHGGISSFSLFLLLYAYLKSIKNLGFYTSNCSGKILYEFLECYSNFNFSIFCIDVTSQNPFILLRELNETGMLILEPFTQLNVAKSSFKIDEIKSCFFRAFNIINQYIINLNNNNDNSEIINYNIINEIFKNRYN